MRGVTVRYGDQSAELKDIRRDDQAGQGRWSFSSQQATLRRLDKAMAAFFRRCKAGRTPGYPRFRGRGWFDSVTWPSDGDGCRWDATPGSGQVRVYLQGVGQVRVHAHRKVVGRVKTITAKREGKRWYVVLSCQDVPAEPLEPTGAMVGIDMGVASFLTTSDGEQIPNPRHLAASSAKLTAAQQRLARGKRGSNRRRQQREQVATVHRKISRQRLDHAHKTALTLVRSRDLIVHEDLRVANMVRSAAGTVEVPGRNVAAKSGLNRSILDAGWRVFLTALPGTASLKLCSAASRAALPDTPTWSGLPTFSGQGLPFRLLTRPEKLAASAVRGVTTVDARRSGPAAPGETRRIRWRWTPRPEPGSVSSGRGSSCST